MEGTEGGGESLVIARQAAEAGGPGHGLSSQSLSSPDLSSQDLFIRRLEAVLRAGGIVRLVLEIKEKTPAYVDLSAESGHSAMHQGTVTRRPLHG